MRNLPNTQDVMLSESEASRLFQLDQDEIPRLCLENDMPSEGGRGGKP
jgi:hypothetical protein